MLIVHSDQKKLHFIPPGSINTMYCILDPGTAHNQESVPSDLPEQCKPSPAYCKCILSPCTRHTIYCERIVYSIRSHRTVNNASHLLHTASAYCILHIQHLTPQLMLQIHLRPSIHFTKLLLKEIQETNFYLEYSVKCYTLLWVCKLYLSSALWCGLQSRQPFQPWRTLLVLLHWSLMERHGSACDNVASEQSAKCAKVLI